jgi:hypothetical protein
MPSDANSRTAITSADMLSIMPDRAVKAFAASELRGKAGLAVTLLCTQAAEAFLRTTQWRGRQ